MLVSTPSLTLSTQRTTLMASCLIWTLAPEEGADLKREQGAHRGPLGAALRDLGRARRGVGPALGAEGAPAPLGQPLVDRVEARQRQDLAVVPAAVLVGPVAGRGQVHAVEAVRRLGAEDGSSMARG